MSKLPLFIATALTAISTFAAHYTLDLTTGATALDAQAPILRKTTVALASECKPPASIAVGDTIDLALFGDVRFTLKIVSAPPAGIAGQSFIARDENGSASAIVKVAENRARISVDDFMNRRQYTVRCKDGQATIFERDNSQEEPGECGTCGGEIEMPQPVEDMTATTTVAPSTKSRKLLGASGNEFPLAEQKSVVDILVAFDQGAKAWAEKGSNWENGGDSIEEFADYAVNKMNMVLEKSQLLDLFSYRLAGVVAIDDTYTQIDQTLLGNLRTRAGALSKLSQLRDKYGADTITLLIDRTQGTATGVGFGYYPVSSFPTPSAFDSGNYACNICDIKTVYSRYTMSHETGHNMGCDHSTRQGPTNSGPGRFEDSSGYHFVDANGVRRYTIMGYNYTDDDDYNYLPVPYFSSPDISPVEYGCAVGVEGTNNNRRTLLQTHGDIAGLRDRKLPYDWDVRFLDDNGNDIADGAYFPAYYYVTMTNDNPNATIYYTYDDSMPTTSSAYCAPGTRFTMSGAKTITACAVVNGIAQSVRTIHFVAGLNWSGDTNGNGLWLNGDSSVRPWNGEYFYNGDAVKFDDLAEVSCATVTVKGAVVPGSVSFPAINTAYTFGKGDDDAKITIRNTKFAPAGDVTFNVPVQLSATTFTNMTGCALTFNAPFGQTIDATSGYCTNRITILPYGTMTVAPGAGRTQTFDTLNNQNGGFSGNATLRVGEGTVVFKGAINGGAGVIGRTQLAVGNGGELVFDVGGGTGHQMNQTSLTVEKGGVVTFNQMEHLCRTLFLSGGTIYAKRLDLMSNPGVYVADDSSIENNGGGYILIRGSDSEINVSDGKTLTLNVGTQTDNRSDTSGWGIIKRGGGTLVANFELKHSGVTDIESGLLEVGYSSGTTAYGQGWIVASNATLKVKSGCSLKVPTLTLDPTATISVPAANSAPLIVNGNVDLTEVRIAMHDVGDLSLGASYPLISATGEISGVKSLVRASWPKPGTGLGWKLEVADGTLTASIVNAVDADPVLDFITDNPSVRFSLPEDASMTENGSLQLNATPIVLDGFTVNAIAVTLDITLGEPSVTERTICSWKIGDNIVRCVVTNGVLDCFHAVSSHVNNSVPFIKLSPGRHVVNVAYKSLSDDTYGGTFVYVDGQLAYRAAGLRWSNDSVSRVTIGASAADTPAYKYEGLVVNSLALLTSSATEPLPNMTSSGGAIEYSYFAGKPPCVFALTPNGGFETYSAVLSARLASSYEALSVSVLASFPEDATGTIFSSVVRQSDSYASYATQVEYRGDGVLAFRDDGGSSLTTCKVSADMASPHLYTMTYKMGVGFKLYMDGEEVLSNSAYFQGKSLLVWARVVFGCGYWTDWMTSYNDNPNPMPNLKVYASHIALGTDDRTVSETAVKDATGYDPEESVEPDPEPPETPATVDVLVAYDNGAQAYVANKGVTLAEFAATQIERMNDVLAANRLDRYYSYRLAGVCKVDGVYDNIDTAPGLIAAGEGPAVSLRAARELYGADTVTLLVDVTGNTLGNSSPLNSPNDVASQHECAFSVCSIRAVDTGKQHTMIHENAHNMGCGHARAQSIINSPFEYGRGYYFKDGNVTRHTIMAYGGDNDASWYFSTTSKEFGFVLGDATNNNARVLKETCAEVAKWREGAAIALAGVDVQDVAFATSALYPWSVEDGTIRSFNQTNYQYQCTTPLRATITGPKVLGFKHKSYFGGASMAGNNYSHFDVLLDDSPVIAQTECTNDWTAAQVEIPEGRHEVVFVFSQRFAMNNGKDYKDGTPAADDAVWLKDIVLTDAAVSTELNIPAGTSVNLSDVGSSIETITGEGTLVCDASLPTKGYGLTSETWKGTVAFNNFNNEDAAKDFQVEKYGNANSKVQFTNCKIPYLKNNNATFAGTVVLDGDAALTIKDGYSSNYNVFGALEGNGTMTFLDKPMQWYVFNTATNFTGSINVQHGVYNGSVIQGRRIVFGTTASTNDLPTQSASITVKPGAEAAIGANATWYAYHGVEIAGTLMVKGANSTLSCNSGGKMGVKFTDGATIRFDAAGAKLNCPTNLTFASGTVKIAFADGVTPANNSVIATWPITSTINGRFKLVGAVTNDYEIATNATGLIFKEKPNDRLDFSGYSYLVEDDVRQWLLDKKPDYYEWEYEMYSWQEYLLDSIGSSNGYTYLQNFLLGYEPEGFKYGEGVQKFSAKIEIVNGEVKITTTEGSIRDGYGLVKWLYRKDKMGDEWKKEKMDGKTITIGAGGSEFYKISIEIEE